jgi:hypothetical protein
LSVLHKIINLTARQTGTDLTKRSRWLRCLFNLSLPCDEDTSLKCIDQVTKIAIQQQGVSASSFHSTSRAIIKPAQYHNIPPVPLLNTPPPSSNPSPDEFGMEIADDELKEVDRYPTTELEWLATTAYNPGVDYFLREDDEKCKVWAEKAFVLAQWLDDKGALRDDMMERYASLQLKE